MLEESVYPNQLKAVLTKKNPLFWYYQTMSGQLELLGCRYWRGLMAQDLIELVPDDEVNRYSARGTITTHSRRG